MLLAALILAAVVLAVLVLTGHAPTFHLGGDQDNTETEQPVARPRALNVHLQPSDSSKRQPQETGSTTK